MQQQSVRAALLARDALSSTIWGAPAHALSLAPLVGSDAAPRTIRDVDGAPTHRARRRVHLRVWVGALEHVPVHVANLAQEERIVRNTRQVDGLSAQRDERVSQLSVSVS